MVVEGVTILVKRKKMLQNLTMLVENLSGANEMGEYVEKSHVESDTKKEIRKLDLMVEKFK